ncbi:MAG TPA: NUDIX domain-containing protein [Mycobacteriales bacterium]|nr:NUDIX domain-containing protein [Mycobacteriales bacterium]
MRQRVGAYALADNGDRTLFCRMSERTPTPGRWTLPGGGLQPGEDPAAAVLRELAEETGLSGSIERLVGVHSNVYIGPTTGESIHGIRLIYAVSVGTGEPRPEPGDTTDAARWFTAAEIRGLDLSDHARYAQSLC